MNKYKFSTNRQVLNTTISESYQDFGLLLDTAKKQTKLKLIKKWSVISTLIVLSVALVYYSSEMLNVTQSVPTIEEIDSPAPQKPETLPIETNTKNDTATIAFNRDPKPQKELPKADNFNESQNNALDIPLKEEEKIIEDVFIQAEPSDGYENLYKYFDQNFTPEINFQLDSSVNKIVVSFLITPSGETTNIKVDNLVHPVLDSIAIETVKKMPKWNPGSLNGHPIETSHKIPLYFERSKK